MAVDAQHLSRFPQLQQPTIDRNMLITGNALIYNHNGSNQYVGAVESLLPMYRSTPVIGDGAIQVTNLESVKDENGLTYLIRRKRPRDDRQSFAPAGKYQKVESFSHSRSNNSTGLLSFLGEQDDLDRLIYHHMEKVRMEIEERQKTNTWRLLEVVKQRILKRLKSKEEKMNKVVNLNWALEQRVRSLATENQIWRELAQTNEATANALRINLAQVLSQLSKMQPPETAAAVVPINDLDDDAESCCGSSSPDYFYGNGGVDGRMCRNCGMVEACVLMLTCRHLSLCAGCGSGRTTCPVCDMVNSASLRVNLW